MSFPFWITVLLSLTPTSNKICELFTTVSVFHFQLRKQDLNQHTIPRNIVMQRIPHTIKDTFSMTPVKWKFSRLYRFSALPYTSQHRFLGIPDFLGTVHMSVIH